MVTEISEKNRYFFRTAAGNICLAAMLVFVSFCALRCGSADMTAKEFFSALLLREGYETYSLIIYSVRLSRIAAGILSGAGLSVSGVLLQKVTDNNLASPNIIGVNSGAGLFIVLLLSFFPQFNRALPFAAFAGALTATLIILAVSNRAGGSKSALILGGIATTALFNACISFLNLIDSDVLSSYSAFSVGSISGVKYGDMVLPAAIIFVSSAFSLALSRKTDLLCLGDSCAQSLGINARRMRLALVICASASAAAVVSFAGLLGFVGLVVPHFARRLSGNSTRHMLLNSVFLGATTVVLSDLAGRVIAAPSEIPVGITMAFIGAPFFMWLVMRKRMMAEVQR